MLVEFAALLSAICWVESSHRPYVINMYDGHSASHGYCQIKESTARGLGFKGKASDLLKKEVNMYWAGKYLRYQLHRYDNDFIKAISAYNAGSVRGDRIINPGYVVKVLQALADGR